MTDRPDASPAEDVCLPDNAFRPLAPEEVRALPITHVIVGGRVEWEAPGAA